MYVLANDESSIEVYLTSLDPSVEQAFQKAAGSTTSVVFAVTQNTLQTLNSLVDKISNSADLLAGTGLVSYGADETTGKVTIGVTDINPTVTGILDDLLGAANISLVKQDPIIATYKRRDDSSPWSGGDAIYHSASGCSSGFSIFVGGTTQLLTAAHCFTNGTSVKNGFETSSGINGSGATIGDVDARQTAANGQDVERIDARVAPNFFPGLPDTTTLYPVNGYENPAAGMVVQKNGSYSGTVDSTIVNPNECIVQTLDNGSTRSICDVASAPSASIANETGDSGGPVSRTVGSNQYALGTVSSGSSTITCSYHKEQTCFKTLYLHESTIL